VLKCAYEQVGLGSLTASDRTSGSHESLRKPYRAEQLRPSRWPALIF
jgi:hypothetical protein